MQKRAEKPQGITIAILAKAPIPGYAKTRLIPALGALGAAALQAHFIRHAVDIACAAAIGPVTLWCAPDITHPLFAEMTENYSVTLVQQPQDEDLGARMGRAIVESLPRPTLLIGTDCPALNVEYLTQAAKALADNDLVLGPVEDGGYVLIAMRQFHPELFTDMAWSTPNVAQKTCQRAAEKGLKTRCLTRLWDVDEPSDLHRMAASGFYAPSKM